MDKKKSNQAHLQNSMSHLVSRAALAQLGPDIEKCVRHYVKLEAQKLAAQQASTLETIFTRVVVLEKIVIDKLGYTQDDLTSMVSDAQDKQESLSKIEGLAEKGDVVRLQISTKSKDQTEFQGTSKLKIYNIGSGQTIGAELEGFVLSMKTGDTQEFDFGQDKSMKVKITIDRVSRPEKQPEEPKQETQSEAQTPG